MVMVMNTATKIDSRDKIEARMALLVQWICLELCILWAVADNKP